MIKFLFRNSCWLLSSSALAGFGAGVSGVGLIATINLALDESKPADASLIAWFVGLCLLLLLTRIGSALLLMRLEQDATFELRLSLSRKILQAPFSRLQAIGPSRILACLTEDIAALGNAVRWLPTLCSDAVVLVGCMVYLGWLSGLWVLLPLGVMVLGVGSFQWVQAYALRHLKTARDQGDTLHGHFRGLTQGIKELKLNASRRQAFVGKCEDTASRYRDYYFSGMKLIVLVTNWGSGLYYLVIGLVLFLLPIYWEVSVEIRRGFCLAILYMMGPLGSLLEGATHLGRGHIAWLRIDRLDGEAAAAEVESLPLPSLFPKPARLDLIGVSHRYRAADDERSFTLGPLDLSIAPGELLFLVGGNGSGKTTLSLLLAGLYQPEQGEIRIGGRRVTEANREAYRQQFSAVFSDFYLFDSLLGFGNRELDAEARAYLAHLQLDHKVKIENGGFSTLDLSQGQRKRLALLVAYLENRPFYLFDEWAADQDPVFKKIFYTEILPSLKAKGKTVIVITHDDAYFSIADRCIGLRDGKLFSIDAKAVAQQAAA